MRSHKGTIYGLMFEVVGAVNSLLGKSLEGGAFSHVLNLSTILEQVGSAYTGKSTLTRKIEPGMLQRGSDAMIGCAQATHGMTICVPAEVNDVQGVVLTIVELTRAPMGNDVTTIEFLRAAGQDMLVQLLICFCISCMDYQGMVEEAEDVDELGLDAHSLRAVVEQHLWAEAMAQVGADPKLLSLYAEAVAQHEEGERMPFIAALRRLIVADSDELKPLNVNEVTRLLEKARNALRAQVDLRAVVASGTSWRGAKPFSGRN